MLLIFLSKTTPRTTYTFKHIFANMLGVDIGFTTKIEEFVGHDGPKISYGKQPLGNELFFQSVDLLFEQGFSDVEPQTQTWGNTIGFFKVSDKSALPFDIFASSFYLLSRYEEYSPHVKDDFGRFPASESLAFQNHFLQSPVVDFWVERLRSVLKERFPDLNYNVKAFSLNCLLAIEEAYSYKRKGIFRTLLGFSRDFFTLKWQAVFFRLRTLLFLQKDPYDVFDDLIQFSKQHRITLKFMFLLSDFSRLDRNISHNRKHFQSLIKSMADYAEVGLLSGSSSAEDKTALRKEKRRLEAIYNRPLKSMLNWKYPMNLPETQNNIADLEIPSTYSMGYPEAIGFRAGTCKPFLFYDINLERITPVRLHPYIFNSQLFGNIEFEDISEDLLTIKWTVKHFEGEFNMVFSNKDFKTTKERNRNLDLIIRLREA